MVFHHLRENSRSSAHLCHVDMQTMKVHRSGPWKNGCQASFFAAQLLIAITNSYSVTPKTCSRSQAPRSCAVTDAFPRLVIGKAKYLLMIQLIPVDILVCPPNCPESWLTCKFSAVVVRMGMGCLQGKNFATGKSWLVQHCKRFLNYMRGRDSTWSFCTGRSSRTRSSRIFA